LIGPIWCASWATASYPSEAVDAVTDLFGADTPAQPCDWGVDDSVHQPPPDEGHDEATLSRGFEAAVDEISQGIAA